MSKNLTRKGLAFGALVALGASVFAGTPAFAADTVVLAADTTSDTTLAVPVTETFTLNGSLGVGSTADIAKLRFKVTQGGGTRSVLAVFTTKTVAGAVSNGADTTISAADGSKYAAAPATLPTSTTKNTLALSLPSAASDGSDATQTVTVLGFLDQNSNGTYEPLVDTISSSVDVKFVKYSELSTTTTISALTENDTKATATVKFNNVNNELLNNAKVGALFTNGTDATLTPTAPGLASGSISGSVVTWTSSAAHNLVAGQIVTIAGATVSGSGSAIGNLNSSVVVASVPSSTTFTAATTGAGTIAGTVTATPTNVYSNVAFSATNGGFKFVTSPQAALAKSTAVKVQPLFNSSAVTTSTNNSVGTAQTAEVTAVTVGSITPAFVKGVTAKNDDTTGDDTEQVASNKEKTVTFLVKNTASPAVAIAGKTVSVTVTTSATLGALAASKTITIAGTTYTDETKLPGNTAATVAKLTAVTDASGLVTFKYTTANFADGDTVRLTGLVENISAYAEGTEKDAVYSSYIENHEANTAFTTDGVAVKVDVVVLDQFGGTPANGKFQIAATETSNTQATTAATTGTGSDTFANVVDGKASLSLIDNGTGLGNAVFALVRYSVAANGVVNTPVAVLNNKNVATSPAFSTAGTTYNSGTSGATTAMTQFTVAVKTAADLVPGEVAITSSATQDSTTKVWSLAASTNGSSTSSYDLGIIYSDFASVDLRKLVGTAPSAFNNAGTGATRPYATITGTVSSANTATYASVAIPGATVTVAAAGMQFSVNQDGADIYGDGTLTFVTGASGAFSINAYSHKAGTQVVTITSGAASAKVNVVVTSAAFADTKTVSVTVADGAAQFQAGRALDVTVALADKFGNAITSAASPSSTTAGSLKISQTGAGYLAASGYVQAVSGKYTTKLITNAGDLGTSTITVGLQIGTSASSTADLSATNSSEFGVTDADVTVGGKAVYASAEFAKGKTVTVTVDGKRLYSKLQTTDNYTELKFTQKKAGKHVVTVRVSGGLVVSETVVTTK